MAKLTFKNGIGGIVLRVKIMDSTSTTGGGKTGLDHTAAGLVISTIADNEAAPVAYGQEDNEIETVATLGTYAAPTESKCRFREVDADLHPGVYEIQLPQSRLAVAGARSMLVTVQGAENAAPVDAEIQLETKVIADLNDLSLSAILGANIDSTEAQSVTICKALEAMLAVLAGVAEFDGTTGRESFKGRDGSTTIVSNTLTGSGRRTSSSIN